VTRDVPAALQGALDTGVTTLARAWTVTRADGLRLGFTDHDRALVFDGVVHEADAGVNAAAVEQATGLAVDTHSIAGALSSDAIADADLERGLYDGAEVLFWLVDWTAPESRLLQARGTVAEVRRGAHAFEAEIAGLAEAMNRPAGRAYLRTCRHRLGDAGCGVDLSDPAFRATGTVVAADGPLMLRVDGLAAFASGWFDRGALTWQDGANAGSRAEVKAHRAGEGAVTLALWQAPALPVAPGDSFTVPAGCDKTLAICRDRFANVVNFGGFPHMPGDDRAVAYPAGGGGHDGGSLFRR